jgi:hypothetical protein
MVRWWVRFRRIDSKIFIPALKAALSSSISRSIACCSTVRKSIHAYCVISCTYTSEKRTEFNLKYSRTCT